VNQPSANRGGEGKAALRQHMLEALRALTAAERTRRSAAICQHLQELPEWQTAGCVLFFSPMRTEPDITPLPHIAAKAMKLVSIVPRTIRAEAELQLPFEPDLVLVPGLAFTRDGHRLGRGGGFYDRLLAGRAKEAVKIGICFELQLVESLPVEPHDIVLDLVVSG
jgi:5-formyltetrahydrofolate cyclo-ligase